MSGTKASNGGDDDSKLPWSTSDLKQEVKVRVGTTEGARDAIDPLTVMRCWDDVVTEWGEFPALYQKKNSDDEWTTWTWSEYKKQVDGFAKSLVSIGFERFDTVNVIGFNAPEWFFANFGAIAAGGVPAGIYTTNNPDACKYITEHSKAKVVVCDGMKQLQKYLNISKDLPDLKALVVYGDDELPSDIKSSSKVPVYTFDAFLELGAGIDTSVVRKRSSEWKPGQTCTLIYTSGTTGPPKAVMITNDNMTWTVRTILERTRKGTMDTNDAMISYLPLSHVAAQVLDMYVPLMSGCQVYFAQPDALKGSLGKTLKEVRPTAFFGVPRVYEKMYGTFLSFSHRFSFCLFDSIHSSFCLLSQTYRRIIEAIF